MTYHAMNKRLKPFSALFKLDVAHDSARRHGTIENAEFKHKPYRSRSNGGR